MKPVRAQKEIDKIKDNILSKALDVIITDGFTALTMRRLAKDVGMTAPNIYNYFSNKDELFITLTIKGFESLLSKLDSEMRLAKTPITRAQAMLKTYLKFGLENSNYYEIMFTSRTPKYLDYVGTAHEILAKQELDVSMLLHQKTMAVLEEIAEEKKVELNDTKVKVVLTTLWSLLHGMVSLHNSNNTIYLVDNAETIYDEILDKILLQVLSF